MRKIVLTFAAVLAVSLMAPAAHAAGKAAKKQPAAQPAKDAAAGGDQGAAAKDPDAEAKKKAAAMPNDQNKYLGDRIIFKDERYGFARSAVVDSAGHAVVDATTHAVKYKEDPVCIPGGTYLRGIGTDGNGELLFVADCDWKSYLHLGDLGSGICQVNSYFCDCQSKPDYERCLAGTKTRDDRDKYTGPALVKSGTAIRLDTTGLDKAPPNRYGLTYGGLVVPFKFQLTGKKEVKPGATAAPYLGYRFGLESRGIELDAVGFAGIANVEGSKDKTTQSTDQQGNTNTTTKSDSTQLAAFSYGFGLIGVIKGGFQFGAVLGFDHVGNGQGYKYNDKPWLALEIGYSWTGSSGGSTAAANQPGA